MRTPTTDQPPPVSTPTESVSDNLNCIRIFCNFKIIVLIQIYIYAGAAFLAGFILAWIIRTVALAKNKKLVKSTAGYLESERLMRENVQKENTLVHQRKQATELEFTKKLKDAQDLIRKLDEDILLLQKSNEETEALLLKEQPAVYELKLKLIEACNSIARFKAQSELKESNL